MTGRGTHGLREADATAHRQTMIWLAQRISAAVLAACVLVHLALIIYAVRGGLSAAEILGRTRGSVAWGGFYIVFVTAIAVHAPIGLRNVVSEFTRQRAERYDWLMHLSGLLLLLAGLRAVYGVIVG